MEDAIKAILELEITNDKEIQTDMHQRAKERWAKRIKHPIIK